jgi:hypothetical protein
MEVSDLNIAISVFHILTYSCLLQKFISSKVYTVNVCRLLQRLQKKIIYSLTPKPKNSFLYFINVFFLMLNKHLFCSKLNI